jgi:GxxExxY protein
MKNTQKFQSEGYAFMGAAFEVYNERGFGLAEEVYHECLEIELELRGVAFVSKKELTGFYKGRALRKIYVPDLFVSEGIIVELKAVSRLLPEHEAQLLNYLRLAACSVGYLVNFGNKESLEWKRMVL